MSDLPPLQGSAQIQALFGDRALPPDAHAGLVFDRYLRIWTGGLDAPDRRKEHHDTLKAFVRQYNERAHSAEHTALLAEAHARLDRIAGEDGHRAFQTTFRLTTGLGQAHPLENGFVLDPVIGVPLLPGSSVKGLLRAHMRAEGTMRSRAIELLGNETPDRMTGDEQSQAGRLVVLPALPQTWPLLAVDVINCHHPEYYGGGRGAPVDWENPVPVYFLAVDSGVDFVFRLGVRPTRHRDEARDRKDVSDGFELLESALALLGIGAKTAAGYGVMSRAEGRAPGLTRTDLAVRTPEEASKQRAAPSAAAPMPSRGQTVRCRLKAQNKKGKWRVEVVGRSAEGVLDPEGAPEGLAAGQEVTLVVQSASVSQDWAFKWPR